MADLEKTIAIIFQGSDQVSRVTKAIGKNFSSLTGQVENLAAPVANVADGILKADAALGALAVGGMAVALHTAGDFGDSFAEISTLIDTTGQNLDMFRRDILAYSRDSTQGLEDINAAVYTAISAGIGYEQSLEAVRTSEKLAVAGRAELEATTRLLASSLNAYGESTKEADRYSDIFFQTVKLGQTTIPELASALSRVTGVAAGAGIPIETLSAAVAALTGTGIQTSEAVSGLKAAITNIIKPSSEATKLAGELGLNFGASALEARGLDGVLRDVYDATGGNVEVMSRLFGSVEGLNSVLVLARDESGRFRGALDAMATAAGATEAAYQKMSENFKLINQNLANNVQATFIGIGERIQDEYAQVAGGVGDILQEIGRSIDAGAFDPLFDALDRMGGELADFLEGVAAAFPEAIAGLDYSGLLDALEELGDALGGLFDGIDLTTPEGLERALQGILDGIEALTRITAGMVEGFEPFIDAIKQAIVQVNAMDEETQRSFGEILAGAKVIALVGVEIFAALALIKESGVDIGEVFNRVVGGVRVLVNAAQLAFDSVASFVVDFIWSIVWGLEKITSIPIPGLENLNAKLKGLEETLRGWQEGIRAHGAEQIEDLLKGVEQAYTGVAAGAKKATAAIQESGDELIDWGSIDATKDIVIEPKTDVVALADAKHRIDEALPASRTQDIEPRIPEKAIDDVMKQSKLIESALEWKAKVDIAEINAAAKTVKAAFEGVEAGIKSTGTLMDDLWGRYFKAGAYDMGLERMTLRQQIEKEAAQREEQFELQNRLTEAQLEQLEARSDGIGAMAIQVEAAGLEPELEAIMWYILEAIQVRANEEAAEFLLGFNP